VQPKHVAALRVAIIKVVCRWIAYLSCVRLDVLTVVTVKMAVLYWTHHEAKYLEP